MLITRDDDVGGRIMAPEDARLSILRTREYTVFYMATDDEDHRWDEDGGWITVSVS